MDNQPSCNCLGCQAHQQIMTFQTIAMDRLREIRALKEDKITYHDDLTMNKVYTVLTKAGLNDLQILDAINQMQNAGIYFRERHP